MKRGDFSLCVLFFVLAFSSFAVFGREPLTFEQRVKAQEAIEKVYYSHRIWPKENKTPKPPFEKMVSKETIENKVTDYLKKSAALEKYWYRPITGEQLQAEMDRMAKGTKDPATLNELFEALNNDPYLIAECLARPVLADRLVRNWYANDERFHKETREKAEEALKHLTTENFCSYSEGQYSIMTYRLENEPNEEREMLDPEDHSIGLSEDEFAKMFREIPDKGKISEVIEKEDCLVILHTVEKNEGEITIEGITFKKIATEEWLKGQQDIITLSKTEGNILMSLPPVMASGCIEGWDNGILDDVPDPREHHTAVWTGSEMIVWGGGYSESSAGIRYNPSTDTWVRTSRGVNCPANRNGHTAIWTGTEMIIWGDINQANTGAKYNPQEDTWLPTSTGTNCPLAREGHTAIWTGTEMIIWGGYASGSNQNTGGRYSPDSDSWLPTSTGIDCPLARRGHTAIWTGTEMIIWGGRTSYYTNTGGKYNPSTDIWTPTSTGTDCPSARSNHIAIWTGTEMIVWGGNASEDMITGGRYNPSIDTWIPTSVGTNCPNARTHYSTIWTGSEMIIWGGYIIDNNISNTGSRYNPETDTWFQTSVGSNCPSPRYYHTAVWTGTEMIVWGGYKPYQLFNSGGRYNPFDDTWIPTSTVPNVPDGREYHTAVWTGNEMIIWGGTYNYDGQWGVYCNTGGYYYPSLDRWLPTSVSENTPEGRYGHTAIWTGQEMIIWGGDWYDGINHYLNTGSKLNPITDSWTPVSSGTNVPGERTAHTAVWTGSEMIIWGGIGPGYTCLNSGGRYSKASDSWVSISSSSYPLYLNGAGCEAIWTGTEMIVWGGGNTAGRYSPTTDTWIATSENNVFEGVEDFSAIWTGTELIVWGGQVYCGPYLETVERYNPTSDAWTHSTATENVPSNRKYHSAVWTGKEMIIWGGAGSDSFNSGGRYNPITDTWIPTLVEDDCPTPRSDHTAVWTDSGMIIWGGGVRQSGGIYYTGMVNPVVTGSSLNLCPSLSAVLSVPYSYSSYQWNLDGSPISGATSSTYTATVSGSYTVSVTDSNGCSGTSDPHVVTITPCIPNILYSSHDTFTEVTGDGDSYFEKGEKWSVPVMVTNAGNTPATNVMATLTGNGITVCNSPASFGTIAAGGTATATYEFLIASDFTPCGGSINFNLGSKACTELTPAGADETNLFTVQVGQIAAGVPTDLVLQPSTADSYVNQLSAGTNYGTATTMSVQSRVSQAQRTLVMFNLSGIPEDSTINSATLELYASSVPTTGLTLNVHRITGTWTEAGVTWTNQPAYNSTVDTTLAGGTTIGWKIWNIASLVQDWIDGTSVNYGLIVKGSVENDKTALTYSFASKENATSGNRPILRINYTPPTTINCDYVDSGECETILSECAPGNTYENGQMWSGTSQSWPALTGATGYKLYRGVQSGLPNLLTTGNDSCLRYEGATTTVDLSSDDPSGETGRLYWYIVTGTNGSVEGPAGNGRIVNSSGNCE